MNERESKKRERKREKEKMNENRKENCEGKKLHAIAAADDF
jgi:hypothetical protein